MPRYRYEAVDQKGKQVRGRMQAEDEEKLYTALLEEGKYLTGAKAEEVKARRRPLKPDELSGFARELGTLLKAGLPLARVLGILSGEEGIKPGIKRIYEEVRQDVCGGFSLSEAMGRQGRVFPPVMVCLFEAAEASGGLAQAALTISEYYGREHRLRAKIRGALVYPKFLAALLLVVTGLLVGFVLPQFEPLFRLVDELPLPTRILYGITGAVTERWYIWAAWFALFLGLWQAARRQPWFCRWASKKQLSLPLYGRLQRTVYTARFARTLSSLYSAGIPIARALDIAGKAIGNVYLEGRLGQAALMVENGMELSASLKQAGGFLPKLIFAVQVGEESGSLDITLRSMAEALEYDAGQASERMVSCLEPAMVIVMAVVVGFVMIAVMMPIYASYQAIEGVGMALG